MSRLFLFFFKLTSVSTINLQRIAFQQIRKPDQLLPYFVMELSHAIPGLPGLFVSGVFSAALR